MTLEYVDYILWTLQTDKEYLFIILKLMLDLEIWVKSYSQHYAQGLLFIPRIISGIIVHATIIPLNGYY